MAYFLDTNVWIHALKAKSSPLAARVAALHPEEIKVPSMVRAELLFGAEKSTKREHVVEQIRKLLGPFELVPFGAVAAGHHARIRASLQRKGSIIGPNDLVIAATVLAEGGTLVTGNRKEFDRVEGLAVEDWTAAAGD